MKHRNLKEVFDYELLRTKSDHNSSIITTTISSVNHITLSKHQVGNVLDIVLGKNESLLLEDEDGEILGAILLNIPSVINRIKSGVKYEAEVLGISTPTCVQIREVCL